MLLLMCDVCLCVCFARCLRGDGDDDDHIPSKTHAHVRMCTIFFAYICAIGVFLPNEICILFSLSLFEEAFCRPRVASLPGHLICIPESLFLSLFEK